MLNLDLIEKNAIARADPSTCTICCDYKNTLSY